MRTIRLAPIAAELWLAVVRLTRVSHERIRTAETRLAAAEAVIATVPDPLILLDDRRRLVRANAQAASFVGNIDGPRDLAAVLRNPAVLAAADAVLGGEGARVIAADILDADGMALAARLTEAGPGRME